jgi:hypothetical protein
MYPDFGNGNSLDVILVDFDDDEANSLKDVIGKEKAEKILRGCQVHWARSFQRVAKLVTKTKEEQNLFLYLGNQIPRRTKKENVKKLFDILSGSCDILEAKNFVESSQIELLECTDLQCWKKLKNWAEW